MSPLEQLPNTYRPFFGSFVAMTEAQQALIAPILEGRDVILQAGTGLGKTEAVLAPATERLMVDPNAFTILYIVPTKALALDMNHRIKSIYKQLDLKSGIRTGDSKTLCDGNPHLLILTPESLDVFLGSQNPDNRYFLKHVRVLIIDEVHIFLHTERGQQLSHLRRRLEMQLQRPLQTLTLSATIASLEEIASFFSLKNVFYFQQSTKIRKLDPCWVHLKDEKKELIPFFNDLSLRWKCKKLLVFANTRQKCEQLFDLLNQEGIFSQHVLLHYSNLSTKERRFIESSFKEKRTSVCIATSTLEMGIDIGDVDGVVLIGPPPSAMAFLQRIGRGNRRQQQTKFWGVCYGTEAKRQLVRFLALFELAKENQMEQSPLSGSESVLFQQILSCLYAKKTISINSLSLLFKTESLNVLIDEMLTKEWLKPLSRSELMHGGWRYRRALINQQIWSNFPPTEEEYDVILNQEKIASLPFSIVKQLEVGNIVQLTGKILKIIQIEEKKASREILTEETDHSPTTELTWYGMGISISFEVAQKMGEILFSQLSPQGLLGRTQQLLEMMQNRIVKAVSTSSGILVHRLESGAYRYETFLGTVGNFIMHHVIKSQFSSKIRELSVNFDEMGIEINAPIPLESLKLPSSISLFQEFVHTHLIIFKQGFSWNSWLYGLPEALQKKEIATRLLDIRVLEKFEKYQKTEPFTPPEYIKEEIKILTKQIPLKGDIWSIEQEKQSWGKLLFSSPPSEMTSVDHPLTASQIQRYITQKMCPRLARFQRLRFISESHPRFHLDNDEIQSKRQKRLAFQHQMIQELQKKNRVCHETAHYTLKEAIQEVASTSESLFLTQATLRIEHPHLHGKPDLIYLKHADSIIYIEVWDIIDGYSFSYAQKCRIAFYVYLLEHLLMGYSFSLPIKISDFGGFVHRHIDPEKLFDRTHFVLSYFKSGIPRLISQWIIDSMQKEDRYFMDSTCVSCQHFSYCYQETLFNKLTPSENPNITYLGNESNQFPNNTKQWFFIAYNAKHLRWQCWEEGKLLSDRQIHSDEYLELHREWTQSVKQGKNPHFLVYEASEWHLFQKSFQSTPLKSFWEMHKCWTSIQSVLEQHFLWPFEGSLTATQVARCLGLLTDVPPPLSLYHRESSFDVPFDVYRQIWSWCLSHIKSRRVVKQVNNQTHKIPLINAYQAVLHRENECRIHNIIEFQKNPLDYRIENFRAIGPLRFISSEGPRRYLFSISSTAPISKFRVGDFLKLSSTESSDIQDGFSVVLETYSHDQGLLVVRSLSQRIPLNKNQLYALDEDAADWNTPKIEAVLSRLQDRYFRPELIQMLHGHGTSFHRTSTEWLEQWYLSHAQDAKLNAIQKQALFLPFSKKIGLIEGPPGTGKTHLLVWTLIALCAHAQSIRRKIKILVTAQTHQAIDQILKKTAKVLQATTIEIFPLWKLGRYDHDQFSKLNILPLEEPKTVMQDSSLVVGATGFGIYQLLEGKNFPQLFDWVIFDESSQILPAYALLNLIFGKGNALFYGDTQQLSPVVMGDYEHTSIDPRSILQELITKYHPEHRLRLNETYRMNDAICQFASQHWYESQLVSAVPQDSQRLHLSHYPLFCDPLDNALDPSKAMVVVQLDHAGCRQSSQEEAIWIAQAVKRLIQEYFVSIDEIGIISPHRLQNNTILRALKDALPFSIKLPKVDTVERMQGAEFDVVIFSSTVSDKESLHSPFLKDYRRFNVSLTRARKKFIFLASSLFFHSFPMTEKELIAHFPFEVFFKKFS